jgi:tetratricopeptide (TPR) repeat protein|tara:strand:+ start:603 stop:1052 length:450 start_codon:yes stop_codon:yes gene_type:complete
MKQPGDLLNEGEQLLLEGKYEESVEVLTQALNENPKLRRGYLLRARAYEFLGNTELALSDNSLAEHVFSNRTSPPLRQEVWLRNSHIRRMLLGAFWVLVGVVLFIFNMNLAESTQDPGGGRILLIFPVLMAWGAFKVIQGFFGWLREPK